MFHFHFGVLFAIEVAAKDKSKGLWSDERGGEEFLSLFLGLTTHKCLVKIANWNNFSLVNGQGYKAYRYLSFP